MYTYKEQRRILVVEDDMATAKTIIAMLDELGYQNVKHATDGKEALKIIEGKEKLFDVILCDWNMANMTGIEFLRQVRTIHATIPFLMITARGDVSSVREAAALDVTGYIRKPVSIDEIEKRTKKLFDRTSHR